MSKSLPEMIFLEHSDLIFSTNSSSDFPPKKLMIENQKIRFKVYIEIGDYPLETNGYT
ncbi:MAG: hypothetical protein KAU62_01600 [Candidatus Heimdallarchaeota archaeon]|nr:hypothetical protein [Candidatus Heimdallarchaeota archaeon]